MALIYRIEHPKDGRGAYSCNVLWGLCGPYDVRHPGPEDDSKLSPQWGALGFSRYGYIFGFTSIEQMRTWFYDEVWLERMSDAGLELSIYMVGDEHVCIGHTQAVFRRESAKLVERRGLLDYTSVTGDAAPTIDDDTAFCRITEDPDHEEEEA